MIAQRRRWPARIARALVVGIVLSIIVATAFGLRGPYYSRIEDIRVGFEYSEQYKSEEGWTRGEIKGAIHRGFGSTLVEMVARPWFGTGPPSQTARFPLEATPYWARRVVPRTPENPVPGARSGGVVRGSGWPMIALYHEYKWKPQQIGPPVAPFGEYLTPGGIRIKASMGNPGAWPVDYPPTLPYRPVWLGLAANTAFYAAIWLMLCVAVSSVRRLLRKRAGLCPGCAYSREGLANDAVCPECGGGNRKSAR